MSEDTTTEEAQPTAEETKEQAAAVRRDGFRRRYSGKLSYLIRALNKFNRKNKIEGNWNGLSDWQVAKLYQNANPRPTLLEIDAEIARFERG